MGLPQSSQSRMTQTGRDQTFIRSHVTGGPHPTMMKPYEPIGEYLGRLLRFDVAPTQLEVRGSPIIGRLP